MIAKPETHEGGCYCGAVRYRIDGAPLWSGHCHCRSCQKALGGAFMTWAKVAAENFAVVKGAMKVCEKTPGIKRGFCGDCGSTLTYGAERDVSGQDWSEDAWFAAATLDDPSIVSPEAHVYDSHRQPWVRLDDGLPRFSEF
jgi:hypothetical protein